MKRLLQVIRLARASHFACVCAIVSSACNQLNKVDVKLSGPQGASKTKLTKISPLVAKPNETVRLIGKNFSDSMTYKVKIPLTNGLYASVPAKVIDASTASFDMPEGAGLGLKTAEFQAGKRSPTSFHIVANQPFNSLPIFVGEPSDICSTLEYIDRNGDTTKGTKNCTGLSTSDNEKLIPGNIKSGVTIAGVAGLYPSSTYPLSEATVTADLDTPTFNAKIKSGTAFEYWDSSGVKHTGAGDSDIVDSNIANTIDIFGTTGNLVGGAAPDPWDLRVGVTVGAVTGRLKVNCRNRARTAVYNYDGAVTSIPNTSIATGSAIDFWDTIDDHNNNVSGLPPSVISGWTNNDCGGVEASAGDNNVWRDVTTAGSGAASCSGSPENCTMQDKITGLWWSRRANFSFVNSTTTSGSPSVTLSSTAGLVPNMRLTGTGIPASTNILSVDSGTQITMSQNATASASNVTVTINSALWNGAVNYCDALTHNGFSDWRLPTQKELMDSYNHGVRSAASANWMTESNMNNYFWSASSVSNNTNDAWLLNLSFGFTFTNKPNPFSVVCVR